MLNMPENPAEWHSRSKSLLNSRIHRSIMPSIFEDRRIVEPHEIDRLGHVNNIEYLRWTPRAAVRHSDAQGWTTADCR